MIEGPDTKYMMLWCGKWRAVVYMYDAQNTPTTLALRAAKVVLYVTENYWIATYANRGEVIERFDRDPKKRQWEMIH